MFVLVFKLRSNILWGFVSKIFKDKSLDLAQISLPFLKITSKSCLGEGEEENDAKKILKKISLGLRHGGAAAGNRPAAASDNPSSSSPFNWCRERTKLLKCCRESRFTWNDFCWQAKHTYKPMIHNLDPYPTPWPSKQPYPLKLLKTHRFFSFASDSSSCLLH